MSSTTARKAQSLGIITKEFAALMNGIKSMVLRRRKTVCPMEVSVLKSIQDTIKTASVIFNASGTS